MRVSDITREQNNMTRGQLGVVAKRAKEARRLKMQTAVLVIALLLSLSASHGALGDEHLLVLVDPAAPLEEAWTHRKFGAATEYRRRFPLYPRCWPKLRIRAARGSKIPTGRIRVAGMDMARGQTPENSRHSNQGRRGHGSGNLFVFWTAQLVPTGGADACLRVDERQIAQGGRGPQSLPSRYGA